MYECWRQHSCLEPWSTLPTLHAYANLPASTALALSAACQHAAEQILHVDEWAKLLALRANWQATGQPPLDIHEKSRLFRDVLHEKEPSHERMPHLLF